MRYNNIQLEHKQHVQLLKPKQKSHLGASALQVCQKLLVIGISIPDHLHVNLCFISDMEDHIPMLLFPLHLFKSGLASVRYNYSRSHIVRV